MRWLRWTLLLLFVLISLPVLALVGVLAWANTEGGQARLAALAASQVPGLTIEGLHGPLPAMVGAARITMADADGVWLTIEEARLALDYSALLHRVLRIEAVEASRVEISRPPLPSDTPSPESTAAIGRRAAAPAQPASGDRARPFNGGESGRRRSGDRHARGSGGLG